MNIVIHLDVVNEKWSWLSLGKWNSDNQNFHLLNISIAFKLRSLNQSLIVKWQASQIFSARYESNWIDSKWIMPSVVVQGDFWCVACWNTLMYNMIFWVYFKEFERSSYWCDAYRCCICIRGHRMSLYDHMREMVFFVVSVQVIFIAFKWRMPFKIAWGEIANYIITVSNSSMAVCIL